MTWWRRLGGPDAVSWPLFWVTFAASTLAQFALPPLPIPFPVRIISLAVTQVAMFVPLVMIRQFLVQRPGRSYPWLVIAGFVVATVIRAAVLTLMLDWLDGQHDVTMARRLAGSFASTMLVFILTSSVVSTSREQARNLARLRNLQDDLLATQHELTEQISRQAQESVAVTQSRLLAELDLVTSNSDERAAVQSLGRLANEVVRPMSHELAQSVPTWRPAPHPEPSARVRWRTVFALLTRQAPFLPLATAALMTFFMASAAVVYLRTSALGIVLATAVGTWIGLAVANRILAGMLPMSTVRRSFTAIVIAAGLAGAVPAVAVGVLVRNHVLQTGIATSSTAGSVIGATLALCGSAFVGGLALLLAVARSSNAERRRTIEALAESTERLKIELVRLHQTQWYQQRALARALHGALQSSVVSAALRLDAAVREGTADPTLVEEIRADISRQIDVLGNRSEQPPDFGDFILELDSVWSRVAAVSVVTEPTALDALDADPITRAIVMELCREAVSNAVRHGHATQIAVSLDRPQEDALLLTVTSDASPSVASGGPGLGSRLLEDCTLRWTERATDDGRELTAWCPLAAS